MAAVPVHGWHPQYPPLVCFGSLLWTVGVKHGKCLGLALLKQLFFSSTFLLFTFITSCHLLCCVFYLVGTTSTCSRQNVWLCWTFLSHQGWIAPDNHSTVAGQKLAVNCDGPTTCCIRGMHETSRNASSQAEKTTLFSWQLTQSGKFPAFHPTPCLCQELKQLYRECSSAAGSEALVGWEEWAATDRSLEMS